MKIKSIEYENFRNFKEHNKINFSTDGKVDIIYGDIGTGKTTFQQLIKWVIYGRIRFNKTTNDYLYNLEVGYNAQVGEKFRVLGIIEFVHKGINYSATREVVYEKNVFKINEISNTFSITMEDEDKNWKRVNDPVDLIEKLLPSGLESYFFLEGENMIADLKVKGKESAGNLRDALYLMLDLSVYDKATKLIGREDLKSTVLGSLFMEKTTTSSNEKIKELGSRLDSAQNNRDQLEKQKKEIKTRIASLDDIIQSTSEQIGAAKSQEEYESRRNECKKNKKNYSSECEKKYVEFGSMFADEFPKVVIASIIEKAANNIEIAASEQFIHGIKRELIDTLLTRDVCICGNKLTEKEKEHLRGFYKMLPPDGYDSVYTDFIAEAKQWRINFDKYKFEQCINNAIDYLNYIEDEENKILSIEAEMKKYKGIDELVVQRKQAEVDKQDLVKNKEEIVGKLKQADTLIKKLLKNIDEENTKLDDNKNIDYKINIMKDVKKDFEDILDQRSEIYSKKLEEAIQNLVDVMLPAKRKVSVSKDFALRVVDNYDDESKSDGQLTTVSFAYIGGIFKVLNDNKLIDNTEYPLVMDAPFSKLSKETIEKVIEVIPKYAPQMVILIKDDILNYFDEKNLGKIYTIKTNAEKNVAKIKEGKLWQ